MLLEGVCDHKAVAKGTTSASSIADFNVKGLSLSRAEQEGQASFSCSKRSARSQSLSSILAAWPAPPLPEAWPEFLVLDGEWPPSTTGSMEGATWPREQAQSPQDIGERRCGKPASGMFSSSSAWIDTTGMSSVAQQLQEKGGVRRSAGEALDSLFLGQVPDMQRDPLCAAFMSPHLAKPITFMLGNLPYRVTKRDIADAVDYMGLEGSYHVCHIPEATSKKARTTNLGYAFICFRKVESAAAFVDGFGSFRFPGRASEKLCTLKLARLPCRMA